MENKELKQTIIDERTGIEYNLVNGYYIPNIVLPKPRRTGNVGKYGRMRARYLRENKKAEYSIMLIENELTSHLLDIDDICRERIDMLVKQIAEKENVNEEMTILYWNIGKDITENILNNKKAEYGKAVIKKLSQRLIVNYGRGYSRANLFRMLKVYEYYPDFEKFSTVSRKLSWSHFVELLQVKEKLKRDFYTTMCENEFWAVRTLRERIGSALFERTTISKMPEQTIVNDLQLLSEENKMTTNLFFRDPYLLDFLELKDTYSEKDLENAIISELEKFILEMGNDFAFLARQKRITIDGEDFYIDLLFFHRKMKRLVVVELKLDKFRPEHKGQVELYLKWLDKYERGEGEESPIAIILCATKSDMMAQLLELDNSGIHVAQYLTEYVPKEILEQKFKDSIENAKIQLEQRKNIENED